MNTTPTRAQLQTAGWLLALALGGASNAEVMQWNTNANGAFGTAIKWNPATVPGANDIARFDRGDQAYTVTFGGVDRQTRQLIIADDDVTFDLGGATYEVTLPFPDGVVIGESAAPLIFSDTASLKVQDGTLIAEKLSLGKSAKASGTRFPSHYLARGTLDVGGSTGGGVRVANEILVGDAGRGTLNVHPDGRVISASGHSHHASIGDKGTAVGTANVDGLNALWSGIGTLFVGNLGSGKLHVTNGGRLSATRAFLGFTSLGDGEVLVAGGPTTLSRFTAMQDLFVGGSVNAAGGPATLTIQGNGHVHGAATKIWETGTVVLDGGKFIVESLDIAPGGTFDWRSGELSLPNLTLGAGQTLGHSLDLGTDQRLRVWDALTVAANGTLHLDGGSVITRDLSLAGEFNWTSGMLQISNDLTFDPGGMLGSDYAIVGPKTLVVDRGSGAQQFRVGDLAGGRLQLGGSATLVSDLSVIGGTASGDGVVSASDPGTFWNTLFKLTVADEGTGQLEINDGALVQTRDAAVGDQLGSDGTVTVEGGVLRVVTDAAGQNTVPIGGSGKGTVSIRENGSVEMVFHHASVGQMPGGEGTVSVSGPNAVWLLNGAARTLTVGDAGTGHLQVGGGGLVGSGKGFVGEEAGAHGVVQIRGKDPAGNPSSWQPQFLDVGGAGRGEVSIAEGGLLQTQEVFAGSGATGQGQITVDGAGSHLKVEAPADANIVLGVEGTASMNVRAGGRVTASGIFVGDGPDSTATSNVTGPESTVDAEEVVVGFAGTGTLVVSEAGRIHSDIGVLAEAPGASGVATVESAGAWSVTDNLSVGGGAVAGGAGALNVQAGGRVDVGDTLRVWQQGTVNLSGGELRAKTIDSSLGGAFNFTSGTLSVENHLGDLTNDGGTLAPGASPGSTTIEGDYTQSAGRLEIEIGGTTEGTEFDQVDVTGTATLGGGLDVHLVNGFMPGLGDQFTFLTASSVNNTFDREDLPTWGGALTFDLRYGDADVTLEVVARLLAGDANNDGQVTGADLIAVQQGFGRTGASDGLLAGDANDDGQVTGADLISVQQNFGNALTLGPVAAPVPEPTALAFFGGLLGGQRGRRRRVSSRVI